MIDHYDSFTFNLVQELARRGARCTVVECDRIGLDGLRDLAPSGILISPGPASPERAGISVEAVRALSAEVPILGVCLGHQVIAKAFGGRVTRARRVLHGKTTAIEHRGDGLFAGLPQPLTATRYNSLTVDPASLPDCLEVTAWSEDREVMGLRHVRHPTAGVQFHPESILSRSGPLLLGRWLSSLEVA